MIFGFGFFVALLGFGAGAYAVGANLMNYSVVPGWTSIMLTTCLIGSFILVALGVIGEYVAKIYEEVKRRPIYIIDHSQSRRLRPQENDV
jgi:dolichol-phosphate mannosyltransferase